MKRTKFPMIVLDDPQAQPSEETKTTLKRKKPPVKVVGEVTKTVSMKNVSLVGDLPVHPSLKEIANNYIRKRRTIPIPKTKEGGINWMKFLPDIVTSRPDGMTFEDYKRLQKAQQKLIKLRRK